MDSSNTTMGLRTIRWDAEEGVFINEQAVRFRGECPMCVSVKVCVIVAGWTKEGMSVVILPPCLPACVRA